MRSLIVFALVSVVVSKPTPGGYLSPWGAPALSSVSLVQQPAVSLVHQPTVALAQPVVHAAPLAIAKPAATSYSSFQQVVHPVSVAQPVYHSAPVVAQPVYHSAPVVAQQVYHSAPVVSQQVYQPAPVVSQPVLQAVHAAPVVQTVAQPVYQKYLSVGSYGHGW